MRTDSIGFFWEDLPPVKPPKKEKVKNIPPDPTWLLPTYLPHLDLARAWVPELMTREEVIEAVRVGHKFVFDIESYPNYFLLLMRPVGSQKVLIFEEYEYDGFEYSFNREKLQWVLERITVIGFNALHYDIPIATLACRGYRAEALHEASNMLIQQKMRPYEILRAFKTKKLKIDCIDIIELTKLAPSLKVVSARIGCEMIMDLPFVPGTQLNWDQVTIVRWYCRNDVSNTELIFHYHKPRLQLREDFGKQYAVDLRSKSDAQIAEVIFVKKVKDLYGGKIKYPEIREGHTFFYRPPAYIKFHTEYFQNVLRTVASSEFEIDGGGVVSKPPAIFKMNIEVSGNKYQFGKGGLHTKEKSICHVADDIYELMDIDVVSFYPFLMMSFDIYPEGVGPEFKKLLRAIVNQRIDAKRNKHVVTAEGLKIVVNGSFGKTLEPNSILYQPELGIQTTLTGQLLLLMLIERYELCGFSVLSANTDGIVLKIDRARSSLADAIRKEWEVETGLEMEKTNYSAIYSRDVNNYIAFKPGESPKRKGVFGKIGSDSYPPNQISSEAAIAFLTENIPVEKTVFDCKDFTKFITLRGAQGGAVKDGEYLGKVVRWYYSKEISGDIIYAKNGNKVPRSDGARPIQLLPKAFPNDLDHNWYITEAYSMLQGFGLNVSPSHI